LLAQPHENRSITCITLPFLQRGIMFTHEAVREWEMKLAALLSATLRKRRHGAVGNSWSVDETYGYCWRTHGIGVN
jgi:transposase-like protein